MTREIETTHRIMSAISSKNTKPELLLRKKLWLRGLRYLTNYKKLEGKPDIVFTRAKLVIFCDGDFWHGNNWRLRGFSSLDAELSSYSTYWKEKIIRNIERDKQVNEALSKQGWLILRFWTSDILTSIDDCVETIIKKYNERIISM